MRENDTLKNGTSRIGLFSPPPLVGRIPITELIASSFKCEINVGIILIGQKSCKN